MATPSSRIWRNLSKLQNNHGRSVCPIQKSQAPSLHDSGSELFSEKGIISVSMLPPFHSDLSSHQPGNGLIRSHSDSSYSTLVTLWMVSRPVVTCGDQTPGAFKSVASSSTPQLRKFHRASDIIRLQMWKLSSDFLERQAFLMRLQRKSQPVLEDHLPVYTMEVVRFLQFQNVLLFKRD